jgi:hypothetical protein
MHDPDLRDGQGHGWPNQARNSVLLPEDEARMLGQAVVEPEHLLIALARSGTVKSLLAERRVTASDITRRSCARSLFSLPGPVPG